MSVYFDKKFVGPLAVLLSGLDARSTTNMRLYIKRRLSREINKWMCNNMKFISHVTIICRNNYCILIGQEKCSMIQWTKGIIQCIKCNTVQFFV